MGIAFLSLVVAGLTWFYQFKLDDPKLVAQVSADNYLKLGSGSFELTFDLFAPGNKGILVRNIGIVELLNTDKDSRCIDKQISGALRTEFFEGGENGSIAHHLGDGSVMFLPEASKYVVNEQPQYHHSFVVDTGKATTAHLSIQAVPLDPSQTKSALYCPYVSYALPDGSAKTAVCEKFSFEKNAIEGDPSKMKINFLNDATQIVPENKACSYF